MTENTPTPESASSGTNWVTIAIVGGVIIAAILVIFGLMNRSGNDSGGDVTTPAPPATETALPPASARISIVEPANGSVVDIAAPITVSGLGEGLPEGNVVVEALDGAGNVLTTAPTTVTASDAGTGSAGPWSVQLTVDSPSGAPGTIRAFSPSPADGSILADVAVAVIYGEAPPPAAASITIDIPLPGETISAQEVVVVGQGTALPENNVVVRVLDASGAILAEQPATVSAELGGAGEWRATLQYSATPGTTGQIYAFTPSPADGSIMAEASANVQFGSQAQASITIDAPQPGQVVDPAQIVVSGTGTALPENNVVVRALDANGAILAEQPTTATADVGGTGPWSVTLTVDVPGGTPGRIDAFSPSPADGSILAQASVDVVYGAAAAAQPAITVTSPQPDEVVDPAQIVVSGTGTALPENNVVVRAVDENGNVLVEQPTTVDAELGGSGPWTVTLAVEAGENSTGRIEAFSTSPADGSTMAQVSVNVVYGAAAAAQPAITVTSPQPDEVVDPAQIVVSGTGTALPENNVVVRAVDENGNVLVEQPTTVDAELGGSGPWTVTLAVEAGENSPGRIEAFSTSPADGSTMAQVSVNVVYGRPRD